MPLNFRPEPYHSTYPDGTGTVVTESDKSPIVRIDVGGSLHDFYSNDYVHTGDITQFSSASTYSEGDRVGHQGTIYVATDTIGAGAFDHSDWDTEPPYALDSLRKATNAIDTASFRFNFGKVKHPGDSGFTVRRFRDLEGLYARISIGVPSQEGNSTYNWDIWYGIILKQDSSFGGFHSHTEDGRPADTGIAICSCVGLEWLLTREKIHSSVVKTSGGTSLIGRCLTFNHKTGATVDSPRSEKANMWDADVWGGSNSTKAFVETDAEPSKMWTAADIADYLVSFLPGTAGSTSGHFAPHDMKVHGHHAATAGRWESLTWAVHPSDRHLAEHLHPTFNPENMSTYDCLNNIFSTKRGIMWSLQLASGDLEDAGDFTAYIRLHSCAVDDILVHDVDSDGVFDIGDGDVRLQANDTQWYFNDIDHNPSVAQLKIGSDLAKKFSKLTVRGARMTSTFTLGVSHLDRTADGDNRVMQQLVPDWSPVDEWEYKVCSAAEWSGFGQQPKDPALYEAYDAYRASSRFDKVFSSFQVSQGSIVWYGGKYYRLHSPYTSSAPPLPTDPAYWEQISDNAHAVSEVDSIFPTYNASHDYLPMWDGYALSFDNPGPSDWVQSRIHHLAFPYITLAGGTQTPAYQTKNWNLYGLRILRDLPLKEAWDYTKSADGFVTPTARYAITATEAKQSPYRSTFGFVEVGGPGMGKNYAGCAWDQYIPPFDSTINYGPGGNDSRFRFCTFKGTPLKCTSAHNANSGDPTADKWTLVYQDKHAESRYADISKLTSWKSDPKSTPYNANTKKSFSSYRISVMQNKPGLSIKAGKLPHCAAFRGNPTVVFPQMAATSDSPDYYPGLFDPAVTGSKCKGSKNMTGEISYPGLRFTVCMEAARHAEVSLSTNEGGVSYPSWVAGTTYFPGDIVSAAHATYGWRIYICRKKNNSATSPSDLTHGGANWDIKKLGSESGEMVINAGPKYRLDYLVPGTVLGLDAGLPIVADGGVLRDDRRSLLKIARSAHAWYSLSRRQLTMTLRYFMLSSRFVEGTGNVSNPSLGDLILAVDHDNGENDSDGNSKYIRTPITSITYDGKNLTTTINTGTDGIDFQAGKYDPFGSAMWGKGGNTWA